MGEWRPEAIRNGYYVLPNGDQIGFKYDADGEGEGTITILLDEPYRVQAFRRDEYQRMQITIGKAVKHG